MVRILHSAAARVVFILEPSPDIWRWYLRNAGSSLQEAPRRGVEAQGRQFPLAAIDKQVKPPYTRVGTMIFGTWVQLVVVQSCHMRIAPTAKLESQQSGSR